MRYAETDLPSYDHLEENVDDLFRAYLDMRLLELAKDKQDYWQNVRNFQTNVFRGNRNASDPTLPYAYWFDIRANHWFGTPGREIDVLHEKVVPSRYLKVLYCEAVALHKRIDILATPLADQIPDTFQIYVRRDEDQVFRDLLARLEIKRNP